MVRYRRRSSHQRYTRVLKSRSWKKTAILFFSFSKKETQKPAQNQRKPMMPDSNHWLCITIRFDRMMADGAAFESIFVRTNVHITLESQRKWSFFGKSFHVDLMHWESTYSPDCICFAFYCDSLTKQKHVMQMHREVFCFRNRILICAEFVVSKKFT